MATGYTACIKDGATFEEFVWGCARAFGTLILMRDEPHNAPIPKRFEPSDFYVRQLVIAKERLAEVEAMTDEEATGSALKEYDDACGRVFVSNKEQAELAAKYEAMFEKVEAWTPPTDEHVNMKNFMLEQLRESVKWDCNDFDKPPVLQTGAEWKADQIKDLQWKIERYTTEYEKELERTEGRNNWLAALRNSVPIPAKLVDEKA